MDDAIWIRIAIEVVAIAGAAGILFDQVQQLRADVHDLTNSTNKLGDWVKVLDGKSIQNRERIRALERKVFGHTRGRGDNGEE